jgi:hypothetical protein
LVASANFPRATQANKDLSLLSVLKKNVLYKYFQPLENLKNTYLTDSLKERLIIDTIPREKKRHKGMGDDDQPTL